MFQILNSYNFLLPPFFLFINFKHKQNVCIFSRGTHGVTNKTTTTKCDIRLKA